MGFISLNIENLEQSSESYTSNANDLFEYGVNNLNSSSNPDAQSIESSDPSSAIKDDVALENHQDSTKRLDKYLWYEGFNIDFSSISIIPMVKSRDFDLALKDKQTLKSFQDSKGTTSEFSESLKDEAFAINNCSNLITQNSESNELDSTKKDSTELGSSSKKSKKRKSKKSKSSSQKNLQDPKDTTTEPSESIKNGAVDVSSPSNPTSQVRGSSETSPFIKDNISLVTKSMDSMSEISAESLNSSSYNSDISILDKIVLKWDYKSEHLFPVNLGQRDKLLVKSSYNKIPFRFKSVEEYIKIFEPLIILEGWTQLQRSKEEPKSEDNSLLSLCRLSRGNEFVKLSFVTTAYEGCNIYESDILLIWLGKNREMSFSKSPHSFLIKITKIKVEESNNGEKPLMHIRAISCYNENDAYYDFENKLRSEWVAKLVLPMTTLYREYLGVKNLASYPLRKNVLKRICEPLTLLNSKKTDKISSTYDVNLPQARAIGATKNMKKGFYMIQGPPGTGKTKTILGLVNYFVNKELDGKKYNTSSNLNGNKIKSKIMICTPSNTAADEVVRRLKLGIKSSSDVCKNLKILRVGRLDTTQFDVRDVALDTHLGFTSKVYIKGSSDIRKRDPKTRLASLRNKIDEEKFAHKAKLLAEADVICCTLSRAGHKDLNDLVDNVKLLIIDEASQATEPSCLIPLRFNSSLCIMVGDPRQLPPTVISKEATRLKYEYSLFARLYDNQPKLAHLLSIQYRMHPEISILPSKLFYDGKLTDGPDLDKLKVVEWHKNPKFGPYVFYDVLEGIEQKTENFSLVNCEEACVAVWLVESLVKQNPNVDFSNRIGVITPYKNQVRELRDQFYIRFGSQIFDSIVIDTIDGFQGQEKDIIIFSAVRTNLKDLGFLSDRRRMNVSLTRAKNSLFIIANSKSLSIAKTWSKVVKDAVNRKKYIKWTPDLFEPMDLRYRFSNLIEKPPFRPSIPKSKNIKPKTE
jgi:senataxin